MPEWISPVSVRAVCGQYSGHEADKFIDGDLGTYWMHTTDHYHSITLDLGQSYLVSRIRWYLDAWANARVRFVDVYFSDTLGDWGSPVGEDLRFDQNNQWNYRDLTPKQGRYVYISSIDVIQTGGICHCNEVEFEGEAVATAEPYSFIM